MMDILVEYLASMSAVETEFTRHECTSRTMEYLGEEAEDGMERQEITGR